MVPLALVALPPAETDAFVSLGASGVVGPAALAPAVAIATATFVVGGSCCGVLCALSALPVAPAVS